jgi:hypothetical protein
MARHTGWSILSAAALCGLILGSATLAQGPERATYDFEDGVQSFMALHAREGGVEPDSTATLTVAKDKENVHGGAGALAYTYKVEPNAYRTVAAMAPIPKGTQSVRFWVKSGASTALIFTLRDQAGTDRTLSVYVPAGKWVPVAANLDEFQAPDLAAGARKLDPGTVNAIGVTDIAIMLVNAGGDIAKALPNFQGQRTIWLDDLEFSPQRVAQTSGPVTSPEGKSYVVDNFESPTIRWTPVHVPIENGMPRFQIFPTIAELEIRPEAAPPGEPKTAVAGGGRGLRLSYNRGAMDIYALIRSLEKDDLRTAERLRLSLNLSRPSLVIVNVKEKDDSEYQHVIMPEQSTGWHTLDLLLSNLTLSDNSKDENNRLDADQIKEISIIDASAFAQLPGGDVTLELDGVSFGVK